MKALAGRGLILSGIIFLGMLIALVASPALFVGAETVQSPYDYGDANMDGTIDLLDLGQIRSIVLLIQDENSAADANMDGRIDLLDLGQARAIILLTQSAADRYVADYDFSSGAGTRHVAQHKQVLVMPANTFTNESGWTAFGGGDYTDVDTIDANDFSMAANATAKNAVQCRFDVDETDFCALNLTHIEINITASSDDLSETLEYWVWNFNTQAWDQLRQDITMANGGNSYYLVSDWGPPNIANYVDASGDLYILLIGNNNNRSFNVDYILMTLVNPLDCGEEQIGPAGVIQAFSHQSPLAGSFQDS